MVTNGRKWTRYFLNQNVLFLKFNVSIDDMNEQKLIWRKKKHF